MRRSMFDYMDVSPKMVFSVATALIPFLQNDDANRALMGSNMQRQAVPLLTTEAPVVGTGMEVKAAVDSGVCVVAKHAGVVERSASNRIIIRCDDGTKDEYQSDQVRTKQPEQLLQPAARSSTRVTAWKQGDVIADGPSTSNGEIALGKNPSDRIHDLGRLQLRGRSSPERNVLFMDDVYTSVHIEEYEAEARDTKLGTGRDHKRCSRCRR